MREIRNVKKDITEIPEHRELNTTCDVINNQMHFMEIKGVVGMGVGVGGGGGVYKILY